MIKKPVKLFHLKLPDPVIDKVRMTIDISIIIKELGLSPFYKDNIKTNFKHLGRNIINKDYHSVAVSIKLSVKEGLNSEKPFYSSVIVFVDPWSTGKKYITIQFNPSTLDVEQCFKLIRSWLFLDKEKYPEFVLAKYCRVTEIHWAIDIKKPIDKFLFHASRKTYEETIYSSGKTIYLGVKSGTHRYCIYDKQKQLKQKHRKAKPLEYVQPIPEAQTTRIESRVKPNGVLLHNLEEAVGNPFKSLTVSYLSSPPENDSLLQLYLLSAQSVGATAAYSILDNSADKKRVARYLKKQRSYWWKPEKLENPIAISIKKLIKEVS